MKMAGNGELPMLKKIIYTDSATPELLEEAARVLNVELISYEEVENLVRVQIYFASPAPTFLPGSLGY